VSSVWQWGTGSARRLNHAEIEAEYAKMETAETYEEWLEAATRLDELEGGSAWKRDPKSPHYDSERIQKRLNEMYKLEAEGDVENMLFWLRSGMSRNLGGIGNANLHNQTHVGTKRLIEEHQDELCRMLHMVCESESVPLERRLSFFTESRHALGKTALLLSGGASLGMYHFGVVTALFNQGLLPRVMSGSSAGAIVLAIIGVRTHEELAELCSGGTEAIERSIRLDFFDPKRSLRRKVWRILTKGVLMDVRVLQDALKHNIGDVTFQEAYERTGRIINITISPGNTWEKPRLLNYLTAPNVLVWSAASASCALPLLFEGVELVAKNAKGDMVPYNLTNVKWTDGSLHTDLPINQLKELFNINFLIVSQVNPHAIPFVQNAHRGTLPRLQVRERRNGVLSRVAGAFISLAKSEIVHRCQQAIDVGVMPMGSVVAGLINQQYVGDITLVAPLCIGAYLNIISNPTTKSLANFLHTAERRAWPSLAHIRNTCRVELTLDDCVRRLAARAQSLMNARVPHSMPTRRRLKRTDADPQEGLLDEIASPLAFGPRANRHTHIDLQSYFGTSTVRSNSSQNLAVFQSFTSERDLDVDLDSDSAPPSPSLSSSSSSKPNTNINLPPSSLSGLPLESTEGAAAMRQRRSLDVKRPPSSSSFEALSAPSSRRSLDAPRTGGAFHPLLQEATAFGTRGGLAELEGIAGIGEVRGMGTMAMPLENEGSGGDFSDSGSRQASDIGALLRGWGGHRLATIHASPCGSPMSALTPVNNNVREAVPALVVIACPPFLTSRMLLPVVRQQRS